MTQNYLSQAIDFYTGRSDLIPCVDYTLQDDGNGVYIKEWNIEGIEQPTIEQLSNISLQIQNAVEFKNIKELATQKQLEAQAQPMFLLDKYYLDCSDDTVNLLIKARVMLEGTNTDEVEIIDYQGIPATMPLSDINLILGDRDSNIIGVISLRRKDLHTQMIEILKKVLLGLPYEIKYI